jgi:hypothetical protein
MIYRLLEYRNAWNIIEESVRYFVFFNLPAVVNEIRDHLQSQAYNSVVTV